MASSMSPARGCDLAATAQSRARGPSARPRRLASASHASRTSHRLVDAAELEQRLDVVVGPRAIGRLEPPELQRARVRSAEPLGAGRSVSTPQSDQPDDGEVIGRMKSEVRPRQGRVPASSLPREVELAAMDGDPGDREMVLGYLDSVLERDVARAGGMLGGELPAPGRARRETAPRGRQRFAARRAPASARTRPREVGARGSSPSRDRRDVGDQVLQPGLAPDSAGSSSACAA